MRILSLINQKGGVGKTTTTASLGAALAARGRSVCLIDLDPQAHLTINFGLNLPEDHPTAYDLLTADAGFLESAVQLPDSVALIPATIDLAAVDSELAGKDNRQLILKQRIEATLQDGATPPFDFVLIDCPPSLGLLTLNALSASTEVVIPMQPHFLALQGVGKLLETVALVQQRINPVLVVSGIVLTMWDPQAKLSHEVLADLQKFIDAADGQNLPWSAAKVYETRIRRNIKLAEAPGFGQTILSYDPGSNGAADYIALAAEIDDAPIKKTKARKK
jgi:chromosome partitioning protein